MTAFENVAQLRRCHFGATLNTSNLSHLVRTGRSLSAAPFSLFLFFSSPGCASVCASPPSPGLCRTHLSQSPSLVWLPRCPSSFVSLLSRLLAPSPPRLFCSLSLFLSFSVSLFPFRSSRFPPSLPVALLDAGTRGSDRRFRGSDGARR